MKTFFNLTDELTIPGRWVINTISVGNMKWCSKSVATCQFMQPSSHDDLCIFFHEIFLSSTKWIALLVILFRALLAVSQRIFEASAKISMTLLCLHKYLLRAYSHPVRIWQFPHTLSIGRMWLTPKHEGWLVLVEFRRLPS